MAPRTPDPSRREFVKAAVAIGGSAALSACLDREGDAATPTGTDPSARPSRQHAWNDALSTDEHGNHVPPRHHLLLYLDYAGDGTPTADDRERTEAAFRSLERAFARSNDGLLFTVGYAPAYFERFDAALPDSVDLPAPEALSTFEDPALDEPDAILHLASDRGSALLAAEEGLLGERSEINGVEMEADLSGVFAEASLAGDGPARRTGFIGEGLPAENADVEGIPDPDAVPDDAPLFMGFESGFEKNQASEDRVTLESGPFAGGTTQHVSKIRLRLDDWYGEQDHDDRVAEMFCPVHAEEGRVEGTGENLGNDNGVGECVDDIEAHAREYGRVGHAQKNARVREDGSPIILRRDFDSTDDGEAGLHFLALQEGISDFVATRSAMNGTDLADNPAVRQRVNNGILEYIFVRRRGNFLLPPRGHRALPRPDP
ncbi:Tat pathway signal protein [Halosimplex aquaticum]|uniref:Tat pathway signal protein n=1 Tax=Halosimplex aquaticum TaxID=3026162 RepID=A0ABD5XY60_9EURY|nr:Tat pathway signal protein [Halosimplex aquaticum]